MNELLFEIGTEEVPAGYLQPALVFLEQACAARLSELGLDSGPIHTVGTPRRLTLCVEDLQSRQPDRRVEHIGPSKKAGFDADGNPTKAAMGFARSRGVTVEDLQVVETPRGPYLMAVEHVQGRETIELLPEILEGLIRRMVFPKSMRWADTSLAFARPIQWLLALYDGQVVEFRVEDTVSGNKTRGHRFMAPESFVVTGFAQYKERLLEHSVLVEPQKRRRQVISEVKQAVAGRTSEGEAVLDDGLLDTVTNLVEIPWGVCGSFDEKFLELPDEALITSMREHQKYFPVQDRNGSLMPLFVAVNNTRIEDRGVAVAGHERVLRARLEDGLFFFNEDKKTPLARRIDALEGIIFQQKLGSMKEKTARIARLAGMLARELAPEIEEDAVRAAWLCKTDLLTEMVGEFPSLQGVMGREYALLDGEKPEVARAISEHYLPLRAGGELPATLQGAIIGIADRIDTLTGCFTIGEKPTGNTDPFGLRRQALGLLHIISGLKISLSLKAVIGYALEGYRDLLGHDRDEKIIDEVLRFIRLRFTNDLVASGTRAEIVEAATSVVFDDVVDCLARIRALEEIRSREEFTVLAGSFKRIRNIIKDNAESTVDTNLFVEEAEKDLYQVLLEVQETAGPLLEKREYEASLRAMLRMKEPVDRFFDQVMVMAEDPDVRQNRLNLLTALGQLVLKVGDISKMHAEG
ncbi:glycine--tRNA ligase subunit beta [Desulfolithobacter sp.]